MTDRIIRKADPTPNGWAIDIEVPNAYTDGASRFERVYVARDEVRGKSPEERRQAILDALSDDPLAGIADQPASEPTQNKAILETRMEALYADWLRWKTTRAEAQARSLAVAVITALTNREDASWAKYATAIQAWRTAP